MRHDHARLEEMNLNLLLALHWLLVEQNVTRAARRVGVTQSAMSRSLAQLRAFFDDPILVQVGRRLELTPRAVGLREPLARSIDGLRSVLEQRPTFDPALTEGAIRMAATEHGMGAVVTPLLSVLRRAAPRLDVQVEPAGPDAFSLLAAGRLDLLIAPKIGRLQPGLVADDLLRETLVTVLRKGSPAAKRTLTLRRFCALEHAVVYPLGGDRQSLVCRALVQRGLERRVAVRVPYFSSALELVARSELALTLPASLAPRRLAIRQPPLEVPGFLLQAVWPERLRDSELHRWVRELLIEAHR